MSQQTPAPDAIIRTGQIITLALVMSALSFAFITLMTGALDQPSSGQVTSLIAACFAFLQAGLALVIPNLIAKRNLSLPEQVSGGGHSYGAYMTRHIIRSAMLEGAAFFNIIATMIEHNWWSLGIAAILVGWILTQFPTRDRADRWLAHQAELNRNTTAFDQQ